ncbi:PREDICTED: DUF724 domain-containing protein 6 [Ipomoea nil]|uniref:DUF724 domain-containing protein 6 n=1 Tax=Ipomoea nil TaxID=35883 RepID=UPI000900BD99|nr:PREDICTED: DUF724 domain-containing protein 6 [Ipomoea nil]XP_019188149.1 PREDICTED: DUF724 domain-containing protein 6 [Ipomoea nil]
MEGCFEALLKTYFTDGAEIEISSNDDGFRGAWYEGKVVHSVSKKVKKNDSSSKKENRVQVVVEYATLMADDDDKQPLQETVDIVQIRPRQPRERRRRFNLSEEVDAYCNDGWWEGIVMRVLDGRKYSVFFRASKEQLDFAESALRLHREWADGDWVPPLEHENDQKIVTPTVKKLSNDIGQEIFHQGMKVEVSSDEEGFKGAWFAATVVKQLDSGNYVIEYQNLRNDDDTEFLQEEADHLHIRPCPPDIERVNSFKVQEKVDALYNDGWWVGVISKVLKGKKYVVHFSNTNELLEFKHVDVRPHQDWIDGKWITASKAKQLSSRTSKSKS